MVSVMIFNLKSFFEIFKKKANPPKKIEPSEEFFCTANRVKAIYDKFLNHDQYLEWNKQIQMRSKDAFFIMSTPKNYKMYLVRLDNKNICVIYNGKTIITAIPYKTEWIRRAILQKLTRKIIVNHQNVLDFNKF
jgi:hypothetical protein